jgi:hypothetical protein
LIDGSKSTSWDLGHALKEKPDSLSLTCNSFPVYSKAEGQRENKNRKKSKLKKETLRAGTGMIKFHVREMALPHGETLRDESATSRSRATPWTNEYH